MSKIAATGYTATVQGTRDHGPPASEVCFYCKYGGIDDKDYYASNAICAKVARKYSNYNYFREIERGSATEPSGWCPITVIITKENNELLQVVVLQHHFEQPEIFLLVVMVMWSPCTASSELLRTSSTTSNQHHHHTTNS